MFDFVVKYTILSTTNTFILVCIILNSVIEVSVANERRTKKPIPIIDPKSQKKLILGEAKSLTDEIDHVCHFQ